MITFPTSWFQVPGFSRMIGNVADTPRRLGRATAVPSYNDWWPMR